MNIDDLTIENYLTYYSIQELKDIGKRLLPILIKYDKNLIPHEAKLRLYGKPVEFLKVLLTITSQYEINYRSSNYNYATHKPAAILQVLKDELVKKIDSHIDITFKFPHKNLTIEDKLVSAWIREKLIQNFDDFDIPMSFGMSMFLLDSKNNPVQHPENKELLRSYAQRPLSLANVVHSYCKSVMDYLKLTYDLNPHEAKLYSEQQLSFFYELLCLMKFEGFEERFDDDIKPVATDIDRLYQTLNYQERLNR